MLTLAPFDLPRLEDGVDPLVFRVCPRPSCAVATRVRVLSRGLALQLRARTCTQLWVEEQLRQLRLHKDPCAADDFAVDDGDSVSDGGESGVAGGRGDDMQRQQPVRRKKHVRLTDEDLQVDWYGVLQLNEGEAATAKQIDLAHRRRCVETHPDKHEDKSGETFRLVQRAFEILGDPDTRMAYDSSRPFDDTIPAELLPEGADFYAVFGPVFERNKKWSCDRDMPSIGNDNTDLKTVYKFYERWTGYQTLRDFSHLVELEEIDDSMCRDEKRYYMRENERQLNRLRREELQRLRTLVERARKNDPRLRRKREADEAERRREKEEREERRRLIREEDERRRAEKAECERRQREEEQRKAIEAKNEIRQAQKTMLNFLEQNGLLDETSTNKLLRHAVRRPNVVWIFSKITSPQQATAIVSDVTNCSTERRPVGSAAAAVKNNCNEKSVKDNKTGGKEEEEEDFEVEAVLRFNALVEEQEQRIGVTRYGEPVKKHTSHTSGSEKVEKKCPVSSENSKTAQWSEEDLTRLQKATAKYPPGTLDRWRKIAAMLRGKFTEEEAMKKVNEITAALQGAKNNASTRAAGTVAGNKQEEQQQVRVQQGPFSGAATAVSQAPVSLEDWTAKQQKSLEQGLRELKDYKEKDKFQKIAAMVDGKSAKECFERYKYLCAMNKRK